MFPAEIHTVGFVIVVTAESFLPLGFGLSGIPRFLNTPETKGLSLKLYDVEFPVNETDTPEQSSPDLVHLYVFDNTPSTELQS